ncbi:MAG: pseudouridine synthase [Thermoanaerobaculia bacterium]|nr:pseudouridine synthase [Thermoanaerobaculia bacterium]
MVRRAAGRPATGEDRVQKILAHAGVASRRGAEELIRQGRVTVNGKVVALGARADASRDSVKVDGRRVRPVRELHYLLLNKPRGCVSTRSDPEGRRTVMDFAPPPLRRHLFPVGRLDYDSEGMMLLTNDGALAERVSHPRYGCEKTYEVKVRGVPDEKSLDRLRGGITLDGRRTLPCEIRRHRVARPSRDAEASSWWSVRLREGRSRQIREMFQRVGHPVQRLRRVAIAGIGDPRLKPGTVRPLTEPELRRLRRAGER